MECCDYNIISIDYNPIAKEPCYIQAARNTELVGMCTAQLVDELVKNHGFNLSKIHPIGYSLGGQVVGYIGNYMQSGRFERSTGMPRIFVLRSLCNSCTLTVLKVEYPK